MGSSAPQQVGGEGTAKGEEAIQSILRYLLNDSKSMDISSSLSYLIEELGHPYAVHTTLDK